MLKENEIFQDTYYKEMEILLLFFAMISRKEKHTLNNTEQSHYFDYAHNRCGFTLPSLHAFMCNNYKIFKDTDYKVFRKILYNSAINSTLMKFNAKVIIENNMHDVDKSQYALIWNL